MLIIGAGGHAKEILLTLEEYLPKDIPILFFDEYTRREEYQLYGKFRIIADFNEATCFLKEYPEFCLGIGAPAIRHHYAQKFRPFGKMCSVISPNALIGQHDTELGAGLNVMPFSFISNSVLIEEGALINTGAYIHHDCVVGAFAELSPGSKLLGGAILGKASRLGTGAVVLPKVKIGQGVSVGAGAVVTKDLPDGVTAVGVPAKVINK